MFSSTTRPANIQTAYEMGAHLFLIKSSYLIFEKRSRCLCDDKPSDEIRVEPQAMEQPLNMAIPQHKFMLAIYLAAPEVENERRALNILVGIRKTKSWEKILKDYYQKNGREKKAENEKVVKEIELLRKRLDNAK